MARAQELLSFNKKKSTTPIKSSSSKNNTNVETSPSCSEDEQEGTVRQAGSASAFKGVKLPTIQIPKFSGEYNNWLEFRDTFISLIHDNKSISSIQKFHYLRASLEGGAAQVIRALEFSSSNYEVAWNSLCDRYDNTRLLIQNHVKAIFNQEPLKKESADSMRKLLDSYLKNLRALDILGEPTHSWDTLLIYIISSKLDGRTLREWEEQKIRHKQLTLEIFTKFLKNRADLLETIELSTNKQQGSSTIQYTQQSYKSKSNIKALAAAAHPAQYKTLRCPLCNEEHSLYLCKKFIQMSVNDRISFVYQAKLCANCFKTGHNKRACRLGPCRACKRKHNTLLHRDEDGSSPSPTTALSASHHCGQVLLATAIVKIRDTRNNWHEVRAVLDSGSQASFMTESLVAKLSLNSQPTKFTVAGINNAISHINKKCNLVIQSRLNDYQANVIFLVLPYITTSTKSVDARTLQIPQNIPLADPDYYSPSSLDLLLGADIFWDLLGTNQIRVNKNYPVLQETKLGYIVSGPTGNPRNSQVSCNLTQFEQIQDQLAKFWAIEELPESSKPALSIEETLCEEHFTKNMTRMHDGRFSVAIPLRMPETALGESFHRAKQCFLALERRFQKQDTLKSMYIEFMEEYASLGHMTKSDINNPPQNSYFMPHHGVLREQSATTKLRAVFNASAPSTSGLSLNDIQMVGPTIQSDLLSILLRFRQHRYVMAGDIEKMYRQVMIHKNQRHLLQIIWRDDPAKPLETYTLNTVTYGTASAPFLAIRCLKQLADECEDDEIRKIIGDDFYVDDLITGHASAEGLMQIKSKVTQVLASGCFNLRKFRSNLPICNDLQSSKVPNLVDLKEQNQSSALGLKWSPDEDQLRFVIKQNTEAKVTKRIYKGLDLVTAKATRQEREAVPHHLLDILEPHQYFTVVDFRDRALKIIDSLMEQKKIPIIVGGTNYYIESIVYKILVEKQDDTESLLWDKSRRKRDNEDYKEEDEMKNKKIAKDDHVIVSSIDRASVADKIVSKDETAMQSDESKTVIVVSKEKLQEDVDNEKQFTNEEIHARLEAIDPVMAKRLHPNNRRKILRSIEVWLKSGRRHSEVLDEQKLSEGHLRRPGATIMLWLKCEQKVHDERLDARVDSMLEGGLINELLDFHDRHNKQRIREGQPADYTKGIFQTLGFKEFHEYLMLPEDQKSSEEGQKLLQQSIADMKMATRRYARRQNKMIRNRFLEHPRREVPPIYELDTTDVSKWDEEVKNKAIQIIECFMNESPCEFEPLKSNIADEKKNLNEHSHNYCEVCNRLIIGDKEFAIHMKSNRHMKVLKIKNREKAKLEQEKQKETEN